MVFCETRVQEHRDEAALQSALRDLDPSAIRQVVGYAGGAESMAAESGGQATSPRNSST
jgi:hypothetical protein